MTFGPCDPIGSGDAGRGATHRPHRSGTGRIVGDFGSRSDSCVGRVSTRTVDVAPMLHSEHDHDVGILVDLVDDSIVAASRGVEALELTDERMPETNRVLGDRTQDRLEGCRPDLLGKSIEVPEAFGSDLDLVQGWVSGRARAAPACLGRTPRATCAVLQAVEALRTSPPQRGVESFSVATRAMTQPRFGQPRVPW